MDEMPVAEKRRVKSVSLLARKFKIQAQRKKGPTPSAIRQTKIPSVIHFAKVVATHNNATSPLSCTSNLLTSPELRMREQATVVRKGNKAKRDGSSDWIVMVSKEAAQLPSSPLTCATKLMLTPEREWKEKLH
jgi:hypothetical protein